MAASVAQDSAGLGDLYARCVQLVNENKVSTKNAFDLPLIEHMDDIVAGFMGGKRPRKRQNPGDGPATDAKADMQRPKQEEDALERRFHEASCTIEASARIYACRVDKIHTDTYQILGGLSAAHDDDDAQEEGGKAAKKRRVVGVNTLERNEAHITQNALEMDEESDPTFRRMAAAFDAGGAKGLLLSKLPIVEDLSLVFNGDVQLSRAADNAQTVFAQNQDVSTSQLGCGDATFFCSKLQASKLCPELDHFRRELWGDVGKGFSLPEMVEKLIVPGTLVQLADAGVAPLVEQEMGSFPLGDTIDDFVPDLQDDLPEPFPIGQSLGTGSLCAPGAACAAGPNAGFTAGPCTVPLMDDPNAGAIVPRPVEDAVVFEQLFEKFCGKGQSQFAYFEEACAKQAREHEGAAGALVAADDEAQQTKEPKQRGKKAQFDFSELQQPVKPMETEPAHRHQISEGAAAWQLHKNVPPYMLDRITMPCWPPGKCNFASLSLRPHLMMKLVRREVSGEGPHNFSDLFGFVAVENADAFPWLRLGKAAIGDDIHDVLAFANREALNKSDEEDSRSAGLPANLDQNPDVLFLQPNEKVVGGAEDLIDDDFVGDEPDFGIDLVSKPSTADSSGIGYSRNAKFVDVKLVKKNLWSCIEEDITKAKARGEEMATSFQELVNRTMTKMPASECDNLSVQVCFICALHICNEKNMEVEVGALGEDFEMVAPEGRVKI